MARQIPVGKNGFLVVEKLPKRKGVPSLDKFSVSLKGGGLKSTFNLTGGNLLKASAKSVVGAYNRIARKNLAIRGGGGGKQGGGGGGGQ